MLKVGNMCLTTKNLLLDALNNSVIVILAKATRKLHRLY